MGADLIIYRCSHPCNLGLSVPEGKERLRKYAFEATPQLLDAFFDNYGNGVRDLQDAYAEEVGDGDMEHLAQSHEEGASGEPMLDWGRKKFWERLEEAYKDTVESPGARDVTDLSFGGLIFLVSGGMSWGDEPTEAGPYLGLLDWTGVFDTTGNGSDGELKKGILDLSTAHVPYDKLERNVKDLDVYWRCQAHENGWTVFLGDAGDDNGVPDWFRPVANLARAMCCDFVNFDQDGPTTDLLPQYTETP